MAVLDELPEENTLERSVSTLDWSNELRPYEEDWLVEYESYLGLCPFTVLAPLALPGPHCCSWVVRLPVDAIVMPAACAFGGGRGPVGCELPFASVEGSKEGYW